MSRPLTVACLLAFCPPALAAEGGALRTFNDWAIACDNARFCRAMGASSEDGGKGPALIVARDGEGTAPPHLLLIWPDDPSGKTLRLSADGDVIGELDPERDIEQTDRHGGGHLIKSESLTQRLLAAMRKAKSIAVAEVGSSEQPYDISLAGASAALLFMDDRQKRVGTKTALVRAGDRDPSSIPPPPRLPVLPQAPKVTKKPFAEEAPAAVLKLYRSEARKACDSDDAEIRSASATIAARLSPTQVLYGMQCWRAAYNFGTAFYIHKEGPGGGSATRAVFPDPIDRGSRRDEAGRNHVLSNAEFDEETFEVLTFHKGRGIGDCGSAYAWRWTGAKFEMAAAKLMPICRGFTEDSWLQPYRSNGHNRALAE